MRGSIVLAAALLLAGAGGCDKPNAQKRYRVTFEVRVDRAPAVGARLFIRDRPVKQTDEQGQAQLLLPGEDGTAYQVRVACPPGTEGPTAPITVTLRTLELADRAAAQRGIVQTVQCRPLERTLGVVVRTEGQSNIPVFWQNREIGRTDQGGVAHLTFRVRPQTPVQLELRTAENPQLRPENPRQTFTVAENDDVQVWDQTFQEEQGRRPPRVRSTRRAPPVNRIQRIQSTTIRSFRR
ncbi:MAG: hypothetical protein JNK05_14405 [Myxococcales bacterium]|nr:hypothetical protein [Myxococcales bacterium]